MELKPNVQFPLAVSYNERGLTGYTDIAAKDQYKINFCYEAIPNRFSGRTTLYLTNRPGVLSTFAYGTAPISTVYHLVTPIGDEPTGVQGHVVPVAPWLISYNISNGSTFIVAGGGGTSTIILTSTSHHPTYVTAGLINSVETRVLQIVQAVLGAEPAHRTFYASSIGTWTEIVSTYSSYSHRGKIEIMDGFGFQLILDNKIRNSDLNTISTWQAGNFITKEIVQDYPMGLAKLRNQILAFGYETCEIFHNAGLSPAPLARIPYMTARIGLQTERVDTRGPTEYYATLGRRIYFNSNQAGAYAYDGSNFEKISTPAIEKIFFERPPYSVDVIRFRGQEAISFRLSIIGSSTQKALLFFPEHKEWFEWNSDVFVPIGNGFHLAGTSTYRSRVFSFGGASTLTAQATLGNWQDSTVPYSSQIQFTWPTGDGTQQRMDVFGVIGDTEVSTTTSQLQVQFSDDDGQSYGTTRTIDMTQMRKQLTRCGAFRQRTVRLTHVGNTQIRLEKIVAKISD